MINLTTILLRLTIEISCFILLDLDNGFFGCAEVQWHYATKLILYRKTIVFQKYSKDTYDTTQKEKTSREKVIHTTESVLHSIQ
jgi:hypothetical protein